MKLLKSFSLYTFASIIEKGISFFLLPVFTFYLSTKDFGVLALLTSIISFGLPLITLGVQGAVSVAYFKGVKNNYPSYFSSSIIPPFLIAAIITLIILLFHNPIQAYFGVPIVWIILIPFFCFISFFNSLLLLDYQIKNEPGKYIIFSLSSSSLNILISLLFVVVLKFGYQGRLIGQYLSILVLFLIAFYILLQKKKLLVKNISLTNIKDSLVFGLPLMPHIFGALVISMSDRLFIDHFYGKAELGIYNLAYVLGSAVTIFSASFANAIMPFSYELFTINTFESKLKVVKVYWLFVILMVSIIICVWLVTPFVFKWFIDPKFAGGIKYVSWIMMGYFFQGMYLLFSNVIFYLKKTKVLFYMSFINVGINLGLNYYLVPKMGPIGATYTLCVNYFILFLAISIYCHNIYPLPWFHVFKKLKIAA